MMHRSSPHRMMSHAGEHAESHGRRGRPGDSCAYLGDGLPGDLGTEMNRGCLTHAALASALSQLGEPLDQFDVPHAGLDRLRYIMPRNIHAETGNCIRRLRRRRERIIGRLQRSAHDQQVRVIGSCIGYQSGDMIRAPGADNRLDAQACGDLNARSLQFRLQLRAPFSFADQNCPLPGHDAMALDEP